MTYIIGEASTQSRAGRPGKPAVVQRAIGAREWVEPAYSILSWPMGQYGPLLGFPSLYNPHTVDLLHDLAYKMQAGKASLGDYAPEEEEQLADVLVRRFSPWMVSNNFGVRLFSNGTDATQAAVALARYVTGRNYIVSIGYHGGSSPVFTFKPQNGGVIMEEAKYRIDVEFEHYEAWRETWGGEFDRVAAIIIEVPSVKDEEYAKSVLLNIEWDCRAHKILLIVDEIVTGFRYSPAGALGYYQNIAADFICLGKAMSTYGKISALIGAEKHMSHLREDVFASYTYNDHPFGIADALLTIATYDSKGKQLFYFINGIGAMLRDDLNAVFHKRNNFARVYGHPSRTAIEANVPQEIYWQFLSKLVDEKHILIHRPNFATLSHTPEHVEQTAIAADEVLEEMGY